MPIYRGTPRLKLRRPAIVVVSGAYVGPGDVVSGAVAWGSPARAYSAAFAAGGTAIMDLVDQAGANPVTINILTTGFTDLGAIATWVAAHSVTTIKVTKLYDQTGTGNHFTQATLANMPTLSLLSLNGLPALLGGATFQLVSPGITQVQPYSLSAIYIRTSGAATGAAIGAGNGAILGSDPVANQARVGFGSAASITGIADNAWHSFSGVANGVSGAYNTDGTDVTAQNLGATTFTGNGLRLCSDNTNFLIGKVAEGGIWPAALTPTQRGNLSTNQHSAANGYNF